MSKAFSTMTGNNFNIVKSHNYQYEIVGTKVNLKNEKKIDKVFKVISATLFIQKCWRGFKVRNQLYIEQMIKAMKLQRKAKAKLMLADTLETIFSRITIEKILATGFDELRLNQTIKNIQNDPTKMQKVLKI